MAYMRKDGRILVGSCLMVDQDLKELARDLGVNLTHAFVNGLEMAIDERMKELSNDE